MTKPREELRPLMAACNGQLRARTNGLSCKTRRYTVTVPFSRVSRLGVYNNSVHTAERAFMERYFLCEEDGRFRPALVPQKDAFQGELFKEFKHRVAVHMPHLPPLTERQCADTYRGSKWRVYDEACKSLELTPFSSRDAYLKSFVKFEKQDIFKAPRVINPRSARYNLKLAKFIKHAEKHFYKAINAVYGGRTDATVIKGYNADRTAEILFQKWNVFADTVAVGLDARKFDMHVSQQALGYEHSFYLTLHNHDPELAELLALQLVNMGVAYFEDGDLKFKIDGTRSSGDINTSLGNCILMCAMVWAYAREKQVDNELANNGDDCVVFMNRRSLTRFCEGLDEWFRKRGFSIAVEKPVYEFEQIEFCQMHPVKLSSGWRMLRNHAAVITKDPMCLINISSDKLYRRWLDAVGTCGINGTKGAPVQQAFYRCLHRNANGFKAGKRFFNHVFANTSRISMSAGVSEATITPEARASYWAAFGVTPDEQIHLERLLDQYVIGPWTGAEIERDDLEYFMMTGAEIFTVVNHGQE